MRLEDDKADSKTKKCQDLVKDDESEVNAKAEKF